MTTSRPLTIGLSFDRPSPNIYKAVETVRALGHWPVLITDAALRKTAAPIAPPDTETLYIKDLGAPIDAAAAIVKEVARHVVPLDHWINIVDRLTDVFLYSLQQLGLSFEFLEPYTAARVKPLARLGMSEMGMSRMRFAVHMLEDDPIPRGFQFPFIVKPITGSGSHGVARIRDERQWKGYLKLMRKLRPRSYFEVEGFYPGFQVLVEEDLQGVECEVDGYIHEGKARICALGFKLCDEWGVGFREIGGVNWYPGLLGDHDARMARWTQQVLDSLGFHTGTFHIEGMMRDDGGMELIEVNPRPGGGGVTAIVQLLSGVDLVSECIRLWLGMAPSREPARTQIHTVAYGVVQPERRGKVTQVAPAGRVPVPMTRGVALWRPYASVGDKVDPEGREHYLGEVHIANHPLPKRHEVKDMVRGLYDWMSTRGLVEIK
jgi:hypothetical protein